LVAGAKKFLTCLLRPGTQSSRRLPTRPIGMDPSSVPIETLEIRSVPYSLVPRCQPPTPPVLAVRVSLPPTPQQNSQISGEYSVDQVKTPYNVCSGRKPDLSRLRTFTCHMNVEPPRPRRPVKSNIDASTGFVLGYVLTILHRTLGLSDSPSEVNFPHRDRTSCTCGSRCVCKSLSGSPPSGRGLRR
jgi:hypothetical protein